MFCLLSSSQYCIVLFSDKEDYVEIVLLDPAPARQPLVVLTLTMQPSVAITLAAPAWVVKQFKLDHIQQLAKLFVSANTSISTFTQYRAVQKPKYALYIDVYQGPNFCLIRVVEHELTQFPEP
jgi:hypothetical protein